MNDLLQFALETMTFLLSEGTHTFSQWADKIQETYDNPQAWEVIEELRNSDGSIVIKNGRVVDFRY